MIKAIILSVIIAVAFTAPSEDRMDKVPVHYLCYLRAILPVFYKSHQSILVIFPLKRESDKLTTFLSNPLKAETIMTQLPCGLMEDQDVHLC